MSKDNKGFEFVEIDLNSEVDGKKKVIVEKTLEVKDKESKVSEI
jgi:hypothetical protein